ncbi:MAG: 4-hydroxy-3-methylbut-2-enyl diphosphate reductase [Coriobacteriia bacterium]|nr:4-hydroxy-3-methylbut-2-enyl diphosphate reductase [Coriobacteriia bacterium]
MEVKLAKYAGACYGVERALSLTALSSSRYERVHTLGPLIHNPQVVAELAAEGIKEVQTVEEVPEGVLVIRSHGVAPQVIEKARERGLIVADATCPYVKKAQKAATELKEQGYAVLIVGEKGHPEVEGIDAHAGSQSLVVQCPKDLPKELPLGPLGIVVQTTQNRENLDAIVAALEDRWINPLVKNTICFATTQRQESAEQLAHEVDAMVVVGGRNSGNTTRLAQICEQACSNTHHIERPEEIDPIWFTGVQKVGVTAGASTPQEQITAVVTALEQLVGQ